MLSFILLFVSMLWATTEPSLRHAVSKKTPLSQRLYDVHVLWTSRSKTARDCSVLCATDDRCLSFTFLKNSSKFSDLCRGYSEEAGLLDQGSSSTVPGAVMFQISARWPHVTAAEEAKNRNNKSSPGPSTTADVDSSDSTTLSFGSSEKEMTSQSTTEYRLSSGSSKEEMTPQSTTEHTLSSSSTEEEMTPQSTTEHTLSSSSTEEELTSQSTIEKRVPSSSSEEKMTSQSTTEHGVSPSTELTVTERGAWQSLKCLSDGDCLELQKNTSCFLSSCLCAPGYYYSVSTATCIMDCPSENLTTTYTKYALRSIATNDGDHDELQVENVQKCLDSCSQKAECRSIDLQNMYISVRCYLSSVVALGMGAQEFTVSPGDHYQRQCL